MSPFGGLFGHDKRSARATGKYAGDTGELPALPGQTPLWSQLPQAPPVPQAPQGAPMDVSGLADNSLVQTQPIPSARKRYGAFDDQQYRNTMLQMAAGFFGSQNFGDGMANAANAIAQGNERARRENLPTIGGPDDAFEIYTDPETGERTYRPLEEVQDYVKAKYERLKPKDTVDLNARYAMQLEGLPPERRAIIGQYMADNPDLFPGFNPALLTAPDMGAGVVARNGQTVPQQVAAKQRTIAEGHRQADREVRNGQRDRQLGIQAGRAAAQTSQAATRIGLSRQAGARSERSLQLRENKAGASSDGYEYRTVNGKLQRRKIQ